MKWFFIYAVVLFVLWLVIDLKSESLITGVLAPLVFTVVLLAFAVWCSTKMSRRSDLSDLDIFPDGFSKDRDSGGDGGD